MTSAIETRQPGDPASSDDSGEGVTRECSLWDHSTTGFTKSGGEKVPVTVLSRDETPLARGSLIDLSRAGARIACDARIEAREEVVLTIRVESTDWDIARSARVGWVRPRKDDWDVGFEFVEWLDESVLNRLASAAYLERRRDHRLAIGVRAAVRCESVKERTEVRLEDVSTGGICLSAPIEIEPGERVLLELDDDEGGQSLRVAVRAQWTRPSDEHRLVGCEFLSASAARAVRDHLQLPSRTIGEAETSKVRLSWIGWIGLLVAFFYCLVWVVRDLLHR